MKIIHYVDLNGEFHVFLEIHDTKLTIRVKHLEADAIYRMAIEEYNRQEDLRMTIARLNMELEKMPCKF